VTAVTPAKVRSDMLREDYDYRNESNRRLAARSGALREVLGHVAHPLDVAKSSGVTEGTVYRRARALTMPRV